MFFFLSNRRALEDLFKRPQETQALSTVYLQRLLSFLAGVARLNEPAGQAVLETGFMDVLLALQNDKAHKMEYDDVDELMLKIIQYAFYNVHILFIIAYESI